MHVVWSKNIQKNFKIPGKNYKNSCDLWNAKEEDRLDVGMNKILIQNGKRD